MELLRSAMNIRSVLCLLFSLAFVCICTGENNTADQWNDKGVLLFENESYNESLILFEQAISLEPGHELAWYNKGLALELLGRYDDALAAFERSIIINPLSSDAWYAKGRVLEFIGKPAESEEAYANSDRLYELEQTKNKDSSSDTDIQEEKKSETDKPENDSGSQTEDEEFDRLYLENDPHIAENLHQITTWLQDGNWDEADTGAGRTANFITEYIAEMKSLRLSPRYDSARDTYVFFLKQVAKANREISDLASLYPMYFSGGDDYSKDDNADYMNRLQRTITILDTARAELKRFNEKYSTV